jgi:DNA-binding NarL/FixJ family response regulator
MTLTVDCPDGVVMEVDAPGPARLSVVVQQRQRLFREGIGRLLACEPDLALVATVATQAELMEVCRDCRPAVVVIEGDADEWDVARLVSGLRRMVLGLTAVGLTAWPATTAEQARARRAGMRCLVSRDTGIAGILDALRAPGRPFGGVPPTATDRGPVSPSRTLLTPRELEILSLVAAGLTSAAIAGQLQISHKTVENHKQRIFGKLDVQNQAHAVSVAMRTGVLRPDRVMELVGPS